MRDFTIGDVSRTTMIDLPPIVQMVDSAIPASSRKPQHSISRSTVEECESIDGGTVSLILETNIGDDRIIDVVWRIVRGNGIEVFGCNDLPTTISVWNALVSPDDQLYDDPNL